MHSESPHLEKLYVEMLMALSPGERLMMACRMYDTAKALVIAGIRLRMPDANEAQVRAQVFLQMHRGDFTPEELTKIMRELPNMEFEG
jgi:hypothetical protein